MKKNKGMRAIAKIMLNSLWGKLAQRENLTRTEYISEPSTFFDLVTNPTKLVKNVDVYGEQFLLVNWEDMDSVMEAHACSNVVIAAFVTAQARLKLYGVLEKLNERVLYFDTDSIIYVHKPDQTYGIQLSSIIDLENGRTKYQMQKLRNLYEWDQRTMVTNMWIKMVSASQRLKSKD